MDRRTFLRGAMNIGAVGVIGQAMTEALKRLSARLKTPRPDGDAVLLPDSGNTGPVSLPIRFERTAGGCAEG